MAMRVLPSLLETPSLGIEDGAVLRGEAIGAQLAWALHWQGLRVQEIDRRITRRRLGLQVCEHGG